MEAVNKYTFFGLIANLTTKAIVFIQLLDIFIIFCYWVTWRMESKIQQALGNYVTSIALG